MEAAQQEYEAACNEVKQLAGQQDALRKATQNAADAVSTQQTHLNKAQASVPGNRACPFGDATTPFACPRPTGRPLGTE